MINPADEAVNALPPSPCVQGEGGRCLTTGDNWTHRIRIRAMSAQVQFVHRPIVQIDLSRVRDAAQAIAHRTEVPVIAVIKADAYGLGAREVANALREVNGVAGFYCF